MIVVAAATIYTVELLMSQATATGMHDYETLSLAVGGYWYKVCPAFRQTAVLHQCHTLRQVHPSQRRQGAVPSRQHGCAVITVENIQQKKLF